MKPIKTIAVCGAGTMGSGIAQVTALAGFATIQFDVQATMLEKSKNGITQSLQILVNKGKLTTAEKDAALARLSFTNHIEDCKADVIIEAVVEKLEVKIALFAQLAILNDASCILATNTSSISIEQIAQGLPNAANVVGLHFFNPAPIMKLVEIVQAPQTATWVIEQMQALCKSLGKTAVLCKDAPGFIVNRVARHYYLEAMKLIEHNIATIENVDEVLEAAGFKMGPFKLMDLIGLDINYGVSQIVWQALGQPARLTPSPVQQQKVAAGTLGKKTGQGFYTY